MWRHIRTTRRRGEKPLFIGWTRKQAEFTIKSFQRVFDIIQQRHHELLTISFDNWSRRSIRSEECAAKTLRESFLIRWTSWIRWITRWRGSEFFLKKMFNRISFSKKFRRRKLLKQSIEQTFPKLEFNCFKPTIIERKKEDFRLFWWRRRAARISKKS